VSDLYIGPYPIDMTPNEAREEILRMTQTFQRPLPILMNHFPGAPCWDIGCGTDQRLFLRCLCGETFRGTDVTQVREDWALHAMAAMDTGAAK
jgi:hypothetical protein